ncbi:replication initiation protein, partial [Bacillus toyonensis]|nr:replication initiation protein [Bacillus toyonensis]
ISFEFEEIKLGRKVQKIRFIIRAQKKKDSDIVHFEKKLDKFQQPNTFEQKIKRFEERCKEKVFPKVFEKWAAHKEIVLEIIEDIRFRSDIDSPIGYVEFILNSRLKELSDKQISHESIQNEDESNNTLLEIDTIIDSVITKYSTSTGTVATFLVKDTTIEELVKVVALEEAEAIWKEKETFVMDKIYEFIKKNRSKKKY